jgi:AraC-like DNA-binding protein
MLFYSSLLTIVLSIILVAFNWKVNKSVSYLALFFVAFACYGLTHHFTLYGNSPFWLAIFYNHFAPLYLLPGPLLYFYTKESLTDKKAIVNWRDYLHFIPALVNIIAIAPYIVSPFSEKLSIASQILQNFDALISIKVNWLYEPIVGFMVRPLLLLAYAFYIYIMLIRYRPKSELLERIPISQYKFVKNWILGLSLISFMSALGFLVLTLNLIQFGVSKVIITAMPLHFVIGIIFCMLPINLLLFPKILYGIPISAEKEKNILINNNKKLKKVVEIEEDPFLVLSNEILAYIQKEKPFVNPEFSMSHIAVIFNVPQHHVAYCFNHVLDKKFTTLRNDFRVSYAIELLDEGLTNSLSIDGIGLKAGFSTRSNFYSSFKRITGLTPSEYLENKGSIA